MNGIDDAVRTLRAAGDPTRLRILLALQRRSLCVCELVALVDVGQPAVSRHLGILQAAGLIESVRNGRWIDYRLTAPAGSAFGSGLLANLRRLAESEPAAAGLERRADSVDRRHLTGTPVENRSVDRGATARGMIP